MIASPMKRGFLTGLVALVLGCAPKQHEIAGDYLRHEEQQPIRIQKIPKITDGLPKKYAPETTAHVRMITVPYVAAQQPTGIADIFTIPPSYKEITPTEQKYTLALDDTHGDFRNKKVPDSDYLLMQQDIMPDINK